MPNNAPKRGAGSHHRTNTIADFFVRHPTDVFAAGGGAAGFLNERKLLESRDVTGTLCCITGSLVVEIAGKTCQGIDNQNGTWKLPAEKFAGLPPGTYDVKVTAKNSIGLIRSDSTEQELTVAKPQ